MVQLLESNVLLCYLCCVTTMTQKHYVTQHWNNTCDIGRGNMVPESSALTSWFIPVLIGFFRDLCSKAIYSAIESWYQRKVCSHYGLWLWLRSRNCHSTGRDGSSCVSDLFNERGRTEFKIGDERQTENIPDGCDKLAANQRRLRGGQTTNSLWLRYLQIYSNLINIKI